MEMEGSFMDAAASMDSMIMRKAVRKEKAEEQRIISKDTMNLLEAEIGRTYVIKEINTEDEEMNAFLFRLGCYTGEPITIVSKKKKSCIVVIKDGRYSIDNILAEAIIV